MLLKNQEIQGELMKKKTHTIQVRLNDQEYQKLLQNCSQSQMQRSDYVRACLAGSQVTEMEYKREIITQLLEMYSILNQMPEVEGRYDLTERMDEICRCLKS